MSQSNLHIQHCDYTHITSEHKRCAVQTVKYGCTEKKSSERGGKGPEPDAFGPESDILKVKKLWIRQGHWGTKCYYSCSTDGHQEKMMMKGWRMWKHDGSAKCYIISDLLFAVSSSLTCRVGSVCPAAAIYTTWQWAACSICLTKITIWVEFCGTHAV